MGIQMKKTVALSWALLLVGVSLAVVWSERTLFEQAQRRLNYFGVRGYGRYSTYVDPVTKEVKMEPITRSEFLPDGTIYELRRSRSSPCDYLTRYDEVTRIHYHFEDCIEGQLGNRLGEYYARWLLARAWRVPFTMSCGDPSDTEVFQNLNHGDHQTKVSVLKLLQKNFTDPGNVPVHEGKPMDARQMCRICNPPSWMCGGLFMMFDEMKQDMRQLSLTQWGFSKESDDAVIHLRLGDALSTSKARPHDENLGIFPHTTYSNILQQVEKTQGPITSIGIVTAPFELRAGRPFDNPHARRSEMITRDLVAHLQLVFPNAFVSIRNDPSETPLTSLTRLTRATKVAVCGASTFCTEAVLATRGKGYLFESPRKNPWAKLAAKEHDNIEMYVAPRLANNYIAILKDEEVLQWMREQDPNVGNVAISSPPLFRARDSANPVSG